MPAHTDSDTGSRLGVDDFFRAPSAPRTFRSTPSISPSTPECVSSTGFAAPVVPDVSWISATSGSCVAGARSESLAYRNR